MFHKQYDMLGVIQFHKTQKESMFKKIGFILKSAQIIDIHLYYLIATKWKSLRFHRFNNKSNTNI